MANQVVISLVFPDGAVFPTSDLAAPYTIADVADLLGIAGASCTSIRRSRFTSSGTTTPGGTGETFPMPSA